MPPHDTIARVSEPSADKRRRRALYAAALAVMVAAVLTGVAIFAWVETEEPDMPAPEASADEPATPGQPQVESIAFAPVNETEPAEPVEIPLDQQGDISFDPEGPCAGITGDAAQKLIVTPQKAALLGGGTKGSIDILNCDFAAVTWSTSTEAWVTLEQTQGELPSGATFRLVFSVNTASLPTGDYSFQIQVSRPGHDTMVDVEGIKLGGFLAPGMAPPPAPGIGGLISEGPTGCGRQCITRAWLTTKPGRADVSLEVATNTSATIAALVDTQAPKHSTAGDPYFTAPAVDAISEGPRTQWVTTLVPLQADTTYHIIVAAKDAGGVSYRTGTFRTPRVQSGFANQVPGGCTSNCLKSAKLTREAGGFEVSVEAHVPLMMQVYVDGAAKASSNGQFVTSWSTMLELKPGQDYQVKLRVTDEQGNSQTHQAVVSTPEPVHIHQNRILVTFHKIRVIDDADNTVFNQKGELRFAFAVDGVHLAQLDTGEHKVKAPAWVSLDTGSRSPGRSVVIENAPDLLSIRVQAQERDNNQRGFCTAGIGMFPTTSGREMIPKCFELEWNTAEGEIDLHQPTGDQALPECYGFGDGIHGDLCIVLRATGEDPVFDVYLTIDFIDG